MPTNSFRRPAAALALIGLAGAALAAPGAKKAHPWPLKVPFAVMDTISTLQMYGNTPGFHHGVDLQAPAGSGVYAPVEGKVGMGYYYPRYKIPYTYMVSITAADGYRWEFHHIDQSSIPQAIRQLAATGGTVRRGALLAQIYDPAAMGIPSHVHVDVIDPKGVYHNGLAFFPPLQDNKPPVIRGVYLVAADNRAVAEARSSGGSLAAPRPGKSRSRVRCLG